MTQQELNQQIAEITGDDLETIQSLGFSIEELDDHLEVIKSRIDWDQCFVI